MITKFILRIHFFVIFCVALSFPLSYVFLSQYEFIMRMTLLTLLINNLLFVVFLLPHLRIKLSYILVALIILINFVIGVIKFDFTLKTILDSALPIIFFAKIIIISNLCANSKYLCFIKENLIFYAKISLFAAIIGVIAFYGLDTNESAYVGLTPSIMPYYILAFLNKSFVMLAITAFIILLSGKRSIILAAIIISVFNIKNFINTRLLIFICLIIFILPIYIEIESLRSIVKLLDTFDAVNALDQDVANNLTGNRLAEIATVYSEMSLLDLPFGQGAGYSYQVGIEGELRTYVHFTPMGLISKYGILITIVIYYFFLKAFRTPLKKNLMNRFLKLFLLAFLVESAFSYLIFNDKILAIVIGVILGQEKMKARHV